MEGAMSIQDSQECIGTPHHTLRRYRAAGPPPAHTSVCEGAPSRTVPPAPAPTDDAWPPMTGRGRVVEGKGGEERRERRGGVIP